MRRMGLTCLLLFLFASVASAAERPNILWLSIEDASCHLGCYGDKHARTPNLDALAGQSILYENAFVCAPVCAPCRSSVITGVYPTSLGTHNMRSMVKLPPEIRPFTTYLRQAGYYCTNNKKHDYQFKAPKSTWDESSKQAHWRNRPEAGQPFFAVFNYEGTHESRTRGDEPAYSRAIKPLAPDELHDPATLELPPYYPDTPKVREDWARYYNTMTAMDKWVAERLAELDEAGLADDTIVFFWSDHGVGLPRAKRWLYDSGIKVPLIVHVPKKWQATLSPRDALAAGTRTDELVSLIDLPETVLNLAGVAIPTYMQGRAFLGTNLTPEREYIFAARDRMDERYDMIRCVRTKRYKYIRNYMPWRPYTQWVSYAERGATMQELRRLHKAGKLTEEQALWMAEQKPLREFYDLEKDPHELHNLYERSLYKRTPGRDTPSFGFAFGRMSEDKTMRAIYDLGIVPERALAEAESASTARYHFFDNLELKRESYASLLRYTRCYTNLLLLSQGNEPDFDNASRMFQTLYGNPPMQSEVPSLVAKLMAADVTTWGRRKSIASERELLLDALENAESPWDRLQAANVLDLLPDFDEHADELRPAVVRVRKSLQDEMQEGPAETRQGLKYIMRCVDRLAERLEE